MVIACVMRANPSHLVYTPERTLPSHAKKQLVLLFSRWRRAPSLALSIRGMEPSPYSTLGRAPSLALSSTIAKSPIAYTVFHCLERPHRLQSLPLSRQALLLAFSFESPSACCCLLPSEILMRLCPTAP